MREVKIPDNVSLDYVADIPAQISSGYHPRIESREEGVPPAKYRVWLWDETVAPAPDAATIETAANEVRKARLKERLHQVAANKRSIAMLEDRQERIIAHVLRITAIEIKVFQGILQQIGRDPVAQGDITQSEFDYMTAIKNRAAKVDAAFDVEKAIETDIESGVISDPDYDIENDPRWQYGG